MGLYEKLNIFLNISAIRIRGTPTLRSTPGTISDSVAATDGPKVAPPKTPLQAWDMGALRHVRQCSLGGRGS